jgi:tetratricopeptide (TPR) repeat protein
MHLVLAAALGVWLLATGVAFTQQRSTTAPSERFDVAVRADFFAGFQGDAARLERAMARCDEELARNPNHPEALVWRGGGLLFQAGTAFQQGDFQKGMELWQRGLAEMNRAVSLAPDDVAVRIPRGATLFEVSRHVPPAQGAPLLKLALEDYEHALQLQEKAGHFQRLSAHAKGELLFGLAEGWARAGDHQKARDYFTRLTRDAADSGRVEYARAWLDGQPPASPGRCTGCH